MELRAQFNALKALIDAQDGSIANLNATVSAQTAEIEGLQVAVPTAVQILGLSYHSSDGTMQVAFAPTGGNQPRRPARYGTCVCTMPVVPSV